MITIWDETIKYIIILLLLCFAVRQDIKDFRISNKLNLFGCICGVIFSVSICGLYGLRNSLIGILIPVIILFPLFLLNILGAGDIKLLSALGSLLFHEIIYVIILSFLLGAVLGVLVMIKKLIRIKVDKGQNIIKLTKVHMSMPIALGTVIFLIVDSIRFW